jgi:hypothetical protein
MDERFQFRLPAQQKAQLESLARANKLSSADLMRLAIDQLLEAPAGARVLLKLPVQHETEAAA